MKSTITHHLLAHAVDMSERLEQSEESSDMETEIRLCLAAHVMLAFVLEGVANEIGEHCYDRWTWEKLEKVDTPLKWRLLSGLFNKAPFAPGKEPLQTVIHVHKIRNRIAHPKLEDMGDEIIIQRKCGERILEPLPNTPLKDGDFIYEGYGKLIKEFNAESTRKSIERTIAAVKALRTHLDIEGLKWLERQEKRLHAIPREPAIQA